MTELSRRALAGAAALVVAWLRRSGCAAHATPVPAATDLDQAPVSVLILNSSTKPDQLTAASASIAEDVSLQMTQLEHGQRVFRKVQSIDIAPESVTSLEPGANHVLLEGLNQSLVQGQVFPLTLDFAGAGSVHVEVRVRRRQDAAGVPETPPVEAGSLTILHASAPPASVEHG